MNCVKKTVKHGGGSLMAWGVIPAEGPGPRIRLHGKANAEVYNQLLLQYFLPYLGATHCSHTTLPATLLERFGLFLFDCENLSVRDWRLQSPDLNSIENIWKLIADRAHFRNSRSAQELWRTLEEQWGVLTFCCKLVKFCN